MPAILGIVALLGAMYSIFQVVTSEETTANKTVWTLLILLVPILGFIIWIVSGPRGQNLLSKLK